MKVFYDPKCKWLNSAYNPKRYTIYFRPDQIEVRRNRMLEKLGFRVYHLNKVGIELTDQFELIFVDSP